MAQRHRRPGLRALGVAVLLSLLAGCGLGGTQDSAGGPFAASATVTTIAAAPLTPSRVYLGTRAGLFVSTDAGRHWPGAPLATFGGTGVRAIAPSAVDAAALWVVTGAATSTTITAPTVSPSPAHSATSTPRPTFPTTAEPGVAGAVWVSHDSGATWHWASARLPGPVAAVWAGSASANQAWAAVLGGGLWYTADDGLDWTAVGGVPANSLPSAVLGTDSAGAAVLLGTSSGLLRSSDGGKHWSTAGDVRGSIYALVAAPAARRTVYCLTDLGLYRSTDGGAHFAAQSYGLPDTMLVVGASPDALYAVAGVNIHSSTDGGHTWTLVQSATTAVAGIAVAVPAGALATPVATAPATPTRSVSTPTAPEASRDSVLVALSEPAGVLVSRDGGLSWSQQGG